MSRCTDAPQSGALASAPTFRNDVHVSASIRNSWATIQLDPDPSATGNAQFGRAIGGDMRLLSNSVVGTAIATP